MGVHTMAWTADTCTLTCCSECETASIVSVTLVFLTLLVCIPLLICNCQRATCDSDTNIDKLFGIVGGTLGFLFTLIAQLVYYFLCANKLPSANMFTFKIGGIDVPVTVHFDYQLGIGQICLIIACLFQLIAVITHLMIQTPGTQWERSSKSELEPIQSAESKPDMEPEEDLKTTDYITMKERIRSSRDNLAKAEKSLQEHKDARAQHELDAEKRVAEQEKELEHAKNKHKQEKEDRIRAQKFLEAQPENLPRTGGKPGAGKAPPA